METTINVAELVKEIQELRLKVANLEQGLKNAEMSISNINNNTKPDPVTTNPDSPAKVPLKSNDNDNDNNSTESISISVISDKSPTKPENALQSNKTDNLPLVDDTPVNENNNSNKNIQKKKITKKISTESWIGKILMGALASLLVFIALITFAKILLPYLTDTMKIILMFITSFALTGTGFFFSKKKPENTFFKALLACGSVCIYLTILVTSIYFKAVSSLIMYILLALWAVLIIFLKKDKNDWLFFSIGNIGYFVSIIFMAGLRDVSLIIPMLIYVVIISIVYQITYWKNKYQKYAQIVINDISLFIFLVITSSLFKLTSLKKVIIVEVVTIVFSFIGFIFYAFIEFFSHKKEHFVISLINTGVFFATFFSPYLLDLRIDIPIILSIIVIIIPAIVYEIITIYWRSKKIAEIETIIGLGFSALLFYIVALILCINKYFIFYSGIILIVYSLIAVYGIVEKDILYKIQGWILVCICMFTGKALVSNMSFTIVAAIIILLSFIIERVVLNNSELFKIVNYFLLLVWIIVIGVQVYIEKRIVNSKTDENIYIIVIYGILAFINVLMILTKFYKTNNKNKEKNQIHIVLDILNLIFMIFGVHMVYALMQYDSAERMVHDTLFKTLYMIIVYILACVNLPLKDKGTSKRYLYTSIKFAFLLCYSLVIFKAPRFIISICMIAYSVVCVALGFRNRTKGKMLRIFGLVTTLIFVVKFIIIDIGFDSSIMKALSYFISGILCFGISAIYNYFEKKGKNNKDTDEEIDEINLNDEIDEINRNAN